MQKKLLFLLGLVCSGCFSKQKAPERKPPKVEVAEILQAAIPISLEAIGHVRAYNFAQIKAQVEGRLMHIHYEQGSDVKEGDLLVTIDPRIYEAKVQEAEGILFESRASLKFAEEKVARFSQLVMDDYVSKLSFDEYVTQREALLASIKKNEGILKEAKVNLDYCFIRAPFSGRVGKKLIDEGNLIENGGESLVTLHQIAPIYVDFSLPEKYFSTVLEKQKEGRLKVKIHLAGSKQIQETGELIVIDNSVDPKTGMIGLRAIFENKKNELWPGEFAKIKLIIDEKENALLVPEAAFNLSQKGYYIYKLQADNTVEKIFVERGQNLGGIYEIIGSIKKGDQVVVSGQYNISDASFVDVVKVEKEYYKAIHHW